MNDYSNWEKANSDFTERYERNLLHLAELLKSTGGAGRVVWEQARFPQAILENTARLRALTEMLRSDGINGRQMLADAGYTVTDEQWKRWVEGQRLIEGLLSKLEGLYASVYGASSEEKQCRVEEALTLLCQYGLLEADPDDVDPKHYLKKVKPAGYGVRIRWPEGSAVWPDNMVVWLTREGKGQSSRELSRRTTQLYSTPAAANKARDELIKNGGVDADATVEVVPLWRVPNHKLTEEQAEEFDPDMPTSKMAKDFALGLDKRGEERIKELDKFYKWQTNGDWVIPYAQKGYEADFDEEANYNYFKEKYLWLKDWGGALGFDNSKFPDEYDSFELFIGQIDQTEWESFIEDVSATREGICMDDDKAAELENEESNRAMKEDWLREIKKLLAVDPRFQEPELQKEIPLLTPDDMWKFVYEYHIYPEREGYGGVTFDVQGFIEAIQPEDILGVTKPPKEHPEFKFESRKLSEADPDDVDPRAYLGRVSTYWGVAYDGTDDKPGWTPQQHWLGAPKKLVWYTGNPWDRWSFYAEDAKQFKSKAAADSFINVIAADKKDWPENMVAVPLPEFWQEALDPDDIDPAQYIAQLRAPKVLVYNTGALPLYLRWNFDDPNMLVNWTHDFKDAAKLYAPGSAEEILNRIDQPHRHRCHIEQRPELAEAIDPDNIDPRAYLKGVLPEYIIRHAGSPYPHQLWWRKSYGWSCQKDKASRFPNPQAAIEFARGGDMEAGYWQKYGRVDLDPVLPGIKEAVDPDAVDPRDYLKHLRRGYVAKAQLRGSQGAHGALVPIPVWFNDNPWGWWASVSRAKVFNSPQEAEQARNTLPKDKQALMMVEPHEEIVQEAADPDVVDPKEYLKHLSRGSIIKLRKLNGEVLYYDGDHRRWWTYDKAEAHVFKSEQEAKNLVAEISVVGMHSIDVVPVEKIMQEARIQRKQLPPEEEIDYKKWVLHGGYDSGTEIYSDAVVRIFRPSSMETWEKYMLRPSRDWASFEEPGPIFIVIPTKGKPWAFREHYDEICSMDASGSRWNTAVPELLKQPGGDRVGPVMAAYYKKKLKQDFDKYFPWVFEFGGLKAVRGYLHRIKPGDNDALDNAIGIHAAETGNFALAAKFWRYPASLMSKKGVWITVNDWQDLTKMFEDDRHSNWQKAAEAVFNGETYDWFEWAWETPVKIEEIEDYLTPEHYKTIREVLVGRTIIIDGEPLLLSPQVLETYKDGDILDWLKNADEYSDGDSLDEIVDALHSAERRALEQVYAEAYYTGYTGEVEDVLGESKWLKIDGKDKLGFLVPWSTIRENMAKYEEDNGERYSGNLTSLMIDYSPKITPAEEYHGSLSDSPDSVKESISNELGELDPGVMPEHQPDPNQPELPIGVPQLTGKKLHVKVYNQYYPNGVTVTMRDRDWEKFKQERPQETSKEAWAAYAKKYKIKSKSPVGEALDPDAVDPRVMLKNLAPKFHILQTWRSPDGVENKNYRCVGGWCSQEYSDSADLYPTRKAAETELKKILLINDGTPAPVNPEEFSIEPVYESLLSEAGDPDDIDPDFHAQRAATVYAIKYINNGCWSDLPRGEIWWNIDKNGWTTIKNEASFFRSQDTAQTECDRIWEVNIAEWEVKPEVVPFTQPVIEGLLQEGHDHAVTLIKLPRQLADFVVNWGKVNIPDEWLYTEEDDDKKAKRREVELHAV